MAVIHYHSEVYKCIPFVNSVSLDTYLVMFLSVGMGLT